jgi:hypothetical protein
MFPLFGHFFSLWVIMMNPSFIRCNYTVQISLNLLQIDLDVVTLIRCWSILIFYTHSLESNASNIQRSLRNECFPVDSNVKIAKNTGPLRHSKKNMSLLRRSCFKKCARAGTSSSRTWFVNNYFQIAIFILFIWIWEKLNINAL